jgi:hypothetical protein
MHHDACVSLRVLLVRRNVGLRIKLKFVLFFDRIGAERQKVYPVLLYIGRNRHLS